MNRDQLVTLAVLCERIAAEVKAALKAEARAEHEAQHAVPTWKHADATIAGSQRLPHVEITDRPTFMAWLQGRHPTVVREVRYLDVTSPEWLERWLERHLEAHLDKLAEADLTPTEIDTLNLVSDDEGTVIPGLMYRAGGEFITASLTPTPLARRRVGRLAKALVGGVLRPELVSDRDRQVLSALLGIASDVVPAALAAMEPETRQTVVQPFEPE